MKYVPHGVSHFRKQKSERDVDFSARGGSLAFWSLFLKARRHDWLMPSYTILKPTSLGNDYIFFDSGLRSITMNH